MFRLNSLSNNSECENYISIFDGIIVEEKNLLSQICAQDQTLSMVQTKSNLSTVVLLLKNSFISQGFFGYVESVYGKCFILLAYCNLNFCVCIALPVPTNYGYFPTRAQLIHFLPYA